jgi:predicted DNA-binding transcriptional regulator YafY
MARGTQFARQWGVLSLLASRRFGMSLGDLSEELGCHARTVRRDVAVLERAGFQPERVRDRVTKEVKLRLPAPPAGGALPLTSAEVLALRLAAASASALPVRSALDSALEKIGRALPVHVVAAAEALSDRVHFRPAPRKDYAPSVGRWDALLGAIRDRRKVEILYRALGRNRADRHVYRPHGLACVEGSIYVLGWSELRGGLRTLLLDRVRRLRVLGERFDRDPGFSPEEYLGESFGILHDGEPRRVVIDFAPAEAQIVRERRWHPTQRLRRLPGGGLRLTMKVAGLGDVLRWALSFGPGARIVRPLDLAERARGAAVAAAAVYGRHAVRRDT